MIWGYHYFWKHPCVDSLCISLIWTCHDASRLWTLHKMYEWMVVDWGRDGSQRDQRCGWCEPMVGARSLDWADDLLYWIQFLHIYIYIYIYTLYVCGIVFQGVSNLDISILIQDICMFAETSGRYRSDRWYQWKFARNSFLFAATGHQ